MGFQMQPTSVIKANLGINTNGEIQKFFTNECYKAMDRYVPRSAGSDGGKLREQVTITANSITYEMPYATYQYFGIREDGTHRVTHYTTPGTGTYWDKRMWSAKGTDIVRRVQEKFGGK